MSQIPRKQSTRIEMIGWFKQYSPGNLRRNFCLRFVTIPVTKAFKKPLCPTRSPVKKTRESEKNRSPVKVPALSPAFSRANGWNAWIGCV